MKRKILGIVMLLLILTSCGKERIEEISKLEKRDGINYVIGEDKPYTGIFIKRYENRNTYIEARFKNGLLHGETKIYFENGDLAATSIYANDKLDGNHKKYYTNGNIKVETMYKNGNREGKHKTYYENGNIEGEIIYKNGEIVPPIRYYDKNGNLNFLHKKWRSDL